MISENSAISFLLAAGSLCQRELVRFWRDKSRVAGALLPPVLFWFLIGSGLGSSFQTPAGSAPLAPKVQQAQAAAGSLSASYLHYFFPGTLVLILLFTAVFATITVIEDRNQGFLQSALITPAPRAALVTGKLFGASIVALAQGLLFLGLAPSAEYTLTIPSCSLIIAIMFLIAFGLCGLGFILAWKLDSTQGFHALMNLFLIPLWLLSGALFPASGATEWVAYIMKANPLSYGLAALRQTLDQQASGVWPSLGFSLLILTGFSLASYAAAIAISRKTNP